jgi:hypothetical protein
MKGSLIKLIIMLSKENSETYEQDAEHRRKGKRKVLQKRSNVHEYQEEWWRQQQEEDA